jgi:hypothetical protein
MVLLCLLFLYIEPQTAYETLTQANAGLIVIALLFTPVIILVRLLRWGLLVHEVLPQMPWYAISTSYLMGFALGVVTPSGLGEVGRGTFLPDSQAYQTTLAVKALLDKLIDVLTLLLLGATGLLLSGYWLAQVLGGLLHLSIVVGMYLLLRLGDMTSLGWLPKPLQKSLHIIKMTAPLRLLKLFGLSLVGFMLLYTQFYLVLSAVAGQTFPLAAIVFFPLITLSTVLPISFNGLGVREWTSVVLLGRYDLPTAVIFNATFGHFILATLPPVVIGLVLWMLQSAPTTEQSGQLPQ